MMNEWFVDASTSEGGNGSLSHPFSGIQQAAEVARPGDLVRVKPGTYREWVRPQFSGSEEAPIVYVADGPGVVLKGSEEVSGWSQEGQGIWKTVLADAFFGDDNSLRLDRDGDWFHALDREHWLGELFVCGQRIQDLGTLEEVKDTPESWTRIEQDGQVELWLHLQDAPSRVELSVRPSCFSPEQTGIHYIHVKGFEMCQAAPPWAPPTAKQMGLIGPNWSKGWMIEDCHLHNVSGCALSLGLPDSFGDNEWSTDGMKHGSQRQREIVFRALNHDWSFESVGSHLIRNCEIHHCGQAGIVGHLGGIGSTLTGNHIYEVFQNRSFSGHEMAGIKLHGALDTVIERNRIHNCCRGIWLDWQAQGTRVSHNLFFDNDWEDLYSEVNHGPLMVDHNVFLSPVSFKDCSQGLAFVHNLVRGQLMQVPIPNRFTPYHVPHSTQVAGVMTIPGGDARYAYNLFLSDPFELEEGEEASADENQNLKSTPLVKGAGTAVYDRYPSHEEEWRPLGGNVNDYAAIRHPVSCFGNLYTGQAKPHVAEKEPGCFEDWQPHLKMEGDRVFFTLPAGFERLALPALDAGQLGECIEAHMGFESPTGEGWNLSSDWEEVPHGDQVSPGPWQNLVPGVNRFRV